MITLAARHRAVPQDPGDVGGSWPATASCPSARRCSSTPAPACTRSTRAPTGSRASLDLEVQGGGRLNLDRADEGPSCRSRSSGMSSGNPLEDRELRRRIDARRYPTIDGELTDMHETGRDGRYLVRGDLTFKGVHPQLRGRDDGVAGRRRDAAVDGRVHLRHPRLRHGPAADPHAQGRTRGRACGSRSSPSRRADHVPRHPRPGDRAARESTSTSRAST